MNTINNFEEILDSFIKNNVDFMLVGGFAVNFHGYNRSTSDLDIWINPIEDNKSKIISSLIQLGFDGNAKNQINQLDFEKPFAFSLGSEPLEIDIFNHITGVKYLDAFQNRIPFQFSDNISVHFISLKDLIVNKMLTGRLQDKADVENLQKIELLKKRK
jgi:hypothetical protein